MTPAHSAPRSEPARRNPAREYVLAPVWCLWQPARAARLWISAPRGVILGGVLAQLVIFASALALAWTWHDALELGTDGGGELLRYRPWPEIWREWWYQGQLRAILIIAFGVAGPLILVLAWLNLPLVHCTGSGWQSYGRTVRLMSLYLAPLTVLTLALGALTARCAHAELLGQMTQTGPGIISEAMLGLVYGSGGVLLLAWCRAARRAATTPSRAPDLPPRCETCGYDLTHQPGEGRCPECGTPLQLSLDPRSRPDAEWARTRRAGTWLASTLAVLVRPTAFYRALRLRTPLAAAHRFAFWHVVLIYPAAATGVLLIISSVEPLWQARREEVLAFSGAILFGTIGCWLGARLLAAVVVTWWLARGALPDFRWATKVVRYEFAFVWVYCFYWGLLLLSFATYEDWISRLLLSQSRSFVPVCEIAAMLGGGVLLTALWFWRYTLAWRAIRWANH